MVSPTCPYCGKSPASGHDAEACRDFYFGTSPEVRSAPKQSVTLSVAAAGMLELLDNRQDYLSSYGMSCSMQGGRKVTVTGPIAGLMDLMRQFQDRDDVGWDQPSSWRVTARRAARVLRDALAEEDAASGPSGTV